MDELRLEYLYTISRIIKNELTRVTCKILAESKSSKKFLSREALIELESERDLLLSIEDSIDKYLLKF